MDRREFVAASGATALASLIGSKAFGQTTKAQETHAHQHDHGMPVKKPVSKQLKELQESTFECMKAGEICLAQCNAVLADGKTSMAECQLAVMDMLAVVDAMSKISVYNTADVKFIKGLAKTCAEFCRRCEKECKPHADTHSECKDCMEACIRCAKACDAYNKA